MLTTELEPGRLLRLRAEMRLPGLAWLEFHVEHDPDGGATTLRQRATFAPRGLFGHTYWWAIAAFHGFVFGGMIRGIAQAAEKSWAPSSWLTWRGPGSASIVSQEP
jgi:hypothetical protein